MTDRDAARALGRVLIEGQFCGFASLAIVNRQLARALMAEGVDVRILPTDRQEGLDEIERAGLASRLASHAQAADIHLRNAWPPETDGMAGRRNGLICWAWEESELSPVTAGRFNRDLDLIMTTSTYVSDALRRSGVVIPVPVVGNGVDHFRAPKEAAKPARRRFLHVSTCLPRKAPEALVRGFVEAFQGRSDVELYIKTSPNPHNRIRAIVEAECAAVAQPPPIVIDERPLSSDELAALYGGATAVVMASRGEGFGLPLAEAMTMGVPVIATRRGGQADFCNEDTAFLVESHPARSDSHVASTYALWEDPSAGSLAEALRRVVDHPAEAAAKAASARRLMEQQFTWAAVARRAIAAMKALPDHRAEAPQVVSGDYEIVSTWDEECGIATYSHQFYGAGPLRDGLKRIWARRPLVAREGQDDPRVDRSWGYDGVSLQRFADKVGNETTAGTLWFQHHPGYFSAGDMRTLLPALRRNRSRLIITLHNVAEALQGGADWLHGFDKVVAHSAQDVEALGRAGVRGEVLPHGVNIIGRPWRADPDHFTVGSFGFLTAHKNIELLVAAVGQARRSDPRIRLVLANSLRRERQSRVAKSRIELLIRRLGLDEVVDRSYDFLSDEAIVERLAPCDLLAFPYGESLEGASGAARMAVALDRPTLLSTSGVFKDLLGFSHVVRRLDVETLAEAILALANDDFVRTLHDPARRRYAKYHHWDVVAARAVTQIMSS
jgi:glycosyltransferase involved in cell wall biosynthesis